MLTILTIWIGGILILVSLLSVLFTFTNLGMLTDDIGALIALVCLVLWPLTIAYITFGLLYLLAKTLIEMFRDLFLRESNEILD